MVLWWQGLTFIFHLVLLVYHIDESNIYIHVINVFGSITEVLFTFVKPIYQLDGGQPYAMVLWWRGLGFIS